MDVPAPLTRFRSSINAAIADTLTGRSGPLFDMMRHHLGWQDGALLQGGKYLRPTLLLTTTEACGGDWKAALPAAVALELLHNFSLIHDDIQDESPLRRNRETVWKQWGASQAINAGDGLHALSQITLLRMADDGAPERRVLLAGRMLDEACLALCEGQYADIAFQDRVSVTIADYEEMIGNKTAAAFRCALELGCLLADGCAAKRSRLGEAGFKMGLAFQIRDDALDLWGGPGIGKETARDIADGKKSLPVVYGLSRAESADAKRLHHLYRQGIGADDVDEVVGLLESLGAPEYCARRADEHWLAGRRMIEESGLPAPAITALTEIGDYLVRRDV